MSSNDYTVRSTSRTSADIREPLFHSLRDNPDGSWVRRIVLGTCVENPKNPDASLRMEVRHQRRPALSASWEDVVPYSPVQLQPNQEIRLEFSSGETLALYRRLEEWYAACSGGVTTGERSLSVVDANDVTILRGHERDVLGRLLEQGEDFWSLLESVEPDLFTAAAVARLHRARVSAVQEFETQLEAGDWVEGEWQSFFRREEWIFGHGLAYQFLDVIAGQPAVGGMNVYQQGLQLPDYLLATRGGARFTVLVEIKRPDARLLGAEYRSVHKLGGEVVGGVAQVQAAIRTWATEGALLEANQELRESGIETVQPKGLLVVGCLDELESFEMRRTFELFRRNLVEPEIVTFDELLERARLMVRYDDHQPEESDAHPDFDDLPF